MINCEHLLKTTNTLVRCWLLKNNFILKCNEAMYVRLDQVQRKPLNMITLGQTETENINHMKTTSKPTTLLVVGQFTHIKRMITLSVIILRVFHFKQLQINVNLLTTSSRVAAQRKYSCLSLSSFPPKLLSLG